VCGCSSKKKGSEGRKKAEVESILRKKVHFTEVAACRLVVYSLQFAVCHRAAAQAAKCCNVVRDYF